MIRRPCCIHNKHNVKELPSNRDEQRNRLKQRRSVYVATVREWLGITPAGANQIVARLEGIGVLREITGYARNRRFRFEPYLRLFEETGADSAKPKNALCVESQLLPCGWTDTD